MLLRKGCSAVNSCNAFGCNYAFHVHLGAAKIQNILHFEDPETIGTLKLTITKNSGFNPYCVCTVWQCASVEKELSLAANAFKCMDVLLEHLAGGIQNKWVIGHSKTLK